MSRSVSSGRSGLTIIELLVVIAILLAITTVGIGVISANSEDRALRETARMVSSTIESAKAEAIANGRQVALVIHPLDDTAEGRAVAQRLSLAEVPPPYAGDYLEATVSMPGYGFLEDSSGDYTIPVGRLDIGQAGPSWSRLVRAGDLIQFNYQGPFLQILNGSIQYVDNSGNTQTTSGWCVRWPGNITRKNVPTPTMAFKVIRQPYFSSSSKEAVTLPAGYCIDLQHSGMGESGDGWHANSGQPIFITFSPSGTVQGVRVDGIDYTNDVVFLSIGKRENILASGSADDPSNLTDLSSRWVALRPNGETTAKQNAGGSLYASRELASRDSTTVELDVNGDRVRQ